MYSIHFRYLFSVLELASEMSDPKLGPLLTPPALGFVNEGLKQALDNSDEKTSFLIIELFNLLFDFIEDTSELLEIEHCEQICDTVSRYLRKSEDLDLNSVKSCAKICSKLWTSTCHVTSFELIGQIYCAQSLKNEDDQLLLDLIKQFLLQFVTLHSNSLQELLNRPVLSRIIEYLSQS